MGLRVLCGALCLILGSSSAFGEVRLTIDAGEDLGRIPAVHGVNGGPLVRRAWRPTSNQQDIDMSAEFRTSRVPESRIHDDGSSDMQRLWRPRTETGLLFTGMDPSDDENWSESGLADLHERMSAADAAGVRNYMRCGHGRLERPADSGVFPFSAIPDDFDVWAEACAELIHRMRELGHEITRVEVWNEPYYTEFWTGTPLEYLALYERTRAAFQRRFGGDVQAGFHSVSGPWGREASLDIRRRQNDENPDNDVHIDFVVSHLYIPTPYQLVDKVHAARVPVENGMPQGVPPLEQYFELVGLPTDTPIVISEWNRGTGVGSEYARTAAGLPVLAGGFAHLIDLHPSTGEHHVDMAHFYSARDGLWDTSQAGIRAGDPRPAGVLWQIMGDHFLGDAPLRLPVSGRRITRARNEPRRGESVDAIASRSEDGHTVYVLLSWFDNREGELYPNVVGAPSTWALSIDGLIPGRWSAQQDVLVDDAGPFYDRHGALETRLREEMNVLEASTAEIEVSVERNSVALLSVQFLGVDPGDSREDAGSSPPADAGPWSPMDAGRPDADAAAIESRDMFVQPQDMSSVLLPDAGSSEMMTRPTPSESTSSDSGCQQNASPDIPWFGLSLWIGCLAMRWRARGRA